MATALQTTRKRAERSDSLQLEDTGVAVAFHLDTDPVTLGEAEAVLAFIRRCMEASIAVYQKRYRELELVAVIEITDGSLKAILRFFYRKKPSKKGKKKKKGQGTLKEIGTEAAKEAAKELAKQAVIALAGALLAWGAIKGPRAPDVQPVPQEVRIVIAKELKPALDGLRQELDKSGKPWTLGIGGVGEMAGSTITLGPRRPHPPAGTFDL